MGGFWKKRVDEKTRITQTGRDTFQYEVAPRRLEFVAEGQVSPPDKLIYPSSISKWLPPHEDEVISVEERTMILEKIKRFFDMNHLTYVVGESTDQPQAPT